MLSMSWQKSADLDYVLLYLIQFYDVCNNEALDKSA